MSASGGHRASSSSARRRVLSATRLHFPPGTKEIPQATVQHLKGYAVSTAALGVPAAIAVNTLSDEVMRIAQEAAPGIDLKVLHVPVWGAFVPALNTLLGEAQRQGLSYILYQSLEVKCAKPVLKLMMDYLMPDTLVVGPQLEGHTFKDGENPLNGRTTPWNTLALWSTRKLALTGFLSIADGLPQKSWSLRRVTGELSMGDRQLTGDRQVTGESLVEADPEAMTTDAKAMGSAGWWESDLAQNWTRQSSSPAGDVPAGVEEVTAIALLQHILGEQSARAVLIQLRPELEALVSWKANWGGDEKRKQWHEYKMASKVARPAAQIRQLFKRRRWDATSFRSALTKPLLPWKATAAKGPQGAEGAQQEQEPDLHFGTVLHFGPSIRPPQNLEWVCLACFMLFSANFTSVFATAFSMINRVEQEMTLPVVGFVSLLIGGLYLPMPLALSLSRLVVARHDHRAGLVLFAATIFIGHFVIFGYELVGQTGHVQQAVVLAARLFQGLGSGVLFQARFALAALSSQDQHLDLQGKMFLASDLGLALGSLLPYLVTICTGAHELSRRSPEMQTSAVLAMLSLLLLLWIYSSVPARLHRLPDSARFPRSANANGRSESMDAAEEVGRSTDCRLLLSGTTRVFVQSAAVIALALQLRDYGYVGSFWQTKGMALLLLLPMPCKTLAQSLPYRTVALGIVSLVAIVVAMNAFLSMKIMQLDAAYHVLPTAVELVALLAALNAALPVNVSNLYKQKDAEDRIVVLEWLKAYVGRLVAIPFALGVQLFFGFRTLLMCLAAGIVVVVLTT